MNDIQITLRNVKSSPALERRIRDKCDALAKFHPGLQYCRVLVEQSERHSTGARPFTVRIHVGLPGRGELVADHDRHVDAFLALRDAFNAMRRQVKDAAGVDRQEVKAHSLPA